MGKVDTADGSDSLSEFDDPVLDMVFASWLDGTSADTDVTDAPARPQPQHQHTVDNNFSDLSSEFDSDRSSEFGDLAFDQELIAQIDNNTLHKYSTAALPSRPRDQLQKPADPRGSYIIPETLCSPPPTDVDCVRVNPVSGFQSADMRFGSGARAAMTKWLTTQFTANGLLDDEDDVSPDFKMDVEAYDCYEEDGHMVDTLDFSDPVGPMPASESETSNKAQLSSPLLSSSPPKSQEPSTDESTETYGTESWSTPPMHAGSSAKGPEARKPPPVSRGRLNLTALSQKYNVFFAAFKEEIHVFRPQQAPEIVRGALLILRPQPTEAAKKIGGYQSTTAPHQVNHMIVGDLGDTEILLMAFDDGDVIAYYTEHIVKYLSSKWRGHPTRSPKKPTPFFRETVGLSAWGLAIHTKSRLIAVSSNLAEVTVFAPALYRAYRRWSVTTESDSIENAPAFHPGRYGFQKLKSALEKRARNWRILLPLGRGGKNIPSIAFVGDCGLPYMIIATDIDGCIWLLNIWEPNSHPLKVQLGQAKAANAMGWGILPIPKSLLLRSNEIPRRIPEVLSREHGLLTHSLNYSLITDPSTDAFIQTPDKQYDRDTIDDVVLPGVPYTKRMLYELDLLSGRDFVYDFDSDEDDDGDNHESGEESDDWHFDMMIDPDTNHVCVGNSAYEYFRNNPEEGMLPAPPCPKTRDQPFIAVDLTSGFLQSMVACPGTSQTWPAPDLSSLLGILRSPTRHYSIFDLPLNVVARHARPVPDTGSHASTESEVDMGPLIWAAGIPPGLYAEDDEEEEEEEEYESASENGTHESVDADDANESATEDGTCDVHTWTRLEYFATRFVFFQTLSSGAQMFSIDEHTDLYQVDDVTKFTTDDTSNASPHMFDMGLPFHRCSMIHFIPEISLIVVGKMQGQVVLLRPFKNNLAQLPHGFSRRNSCHDRVAEINYPRWAFRTEWTLPLQKDRTDDKYPRCCLLGIAVSRVPEPDAGKYALEAEAKPTDSKRPRGNGKSQGRRWRLIMYYMDHTILQYHIEESESGNEMCDVLPVLQEAQQASRMRQQADPTRPKYQDGVQVA
ncbi:hypothetical protein F503_01059 [Ophiostoma piceae UAMH 11346]|uniref:Pyridine nucleotide-disulfide oxidoreductase family protein n=1 Tax=Ophiostoma piceae (strain UAMH 11346) TaxID=1262450 RepID=S3C8L8_OPHP1|nr:hypothetical protein F503_01059 [Ophiostoma piceae UAMH 11346]